ncbi:hypothetical protein GCM10011584_15690 [Nocardioides phosphati]|uniref:Neocarzinostatin n=1 Tax=Nocardioides phosphati TaxID=1867775 RepID=A0ABQ2N9L6_9ACTN|nr:hypothetical protein [Nocardioides phosphati]GGO88514.1 hypothetical protein GCM10011584_15690 [Nocardioides phosphati]
MSRILRLIPACAALLVAAFVSPPAYAGSPHFITSAFVVTVSGSTLTVSGKEAGLGDETQVHIEVTATASCINPGDHHPKAANKASVTAAGDFPVQNGKATFELSATAAFQPDCAPPMTVVFSPITVTDTEHDVSVTLR